MTAPVSPIADHFGAHFRELRLRVLISMAAVVLFSSVAYLFSEPITRIFMAPLIIASPDLATLIYTNLTEAFIAYLKVAVLVGVIGSFPVIFYEIWMFAAPGLRKNEKRLALAITLSATLLFTGGAAFAYFVVLPKALGFLMSFATPELEPLPKLDDYLSFVARSALAFGLAFEIPFLMVAAAKVGFVTRLYFVEKRWMFYLAILVIAFLLTAGDLFSTVLLGLPLFVLYEAGILVMWIFGVRK